MNPTKLFILAILSTVVSSCGFVPPSSQQDVTPTQYSTLFSPAPALLLTSTFTPSVKPQIPTVIPSQTPVPICISINNASSLADGWECRNESYGFTIHFPATAGIARTTETVVDVWLQNSPSNSRIDRMIEISVDKSAESCISSDAKKMQIGNQTFLVNQGFEPSGVVYAWKSYAISKESKNVCFMFIVGFQTWEQNDPLFPPEKDQGLDEVKTILATFRWLDI